MNIQIQERMKNQKALNWNTWLKEGDQYLKAATPVKKKNKFGTDIRYNLLSMAFESYVMSILDYHNDLPDNHTYTDLMDGLERVTPVNRKLRDRILKYENIQSICSIEKYYRKDPTENELKDLKGAVVIIQTMAHDICSK